MLGRILSGDIGGTNSRLLLAEVTETGWHELAEKSYYSANYESFYQVLEVFLSEYEIELPLAAACFAVAGPVHSGRAAITNLPWTVSESELAKFLQTKPVSLINDFVAVSHGIDELQDSDFLVLQPGDTAGADHRHPDAVVIGAGTGLGTSYRVYRDGHYHIFSSETGHVGFAPENELQTKLLAWLQKNHSHVSLETVLSGRGLNTIYQFLRDHTDLTESVEVREQMCFQDPAKVITDNGLLNKDPLCQKTLACFIEIYGAAAGDVALHCYPIGELYVAGGIAPKLKGILSEKFLSAFSDKELMADNMKKIKIKLITQEKVGLWGATSMAKALLE